MRSHKKSRGTPRGCPCVGHADAEGRHETHKRGTYQLSPASLAGWRKPRFLEVCDLPKGFHLRSFRIGGALSAGGGLSSEIYNRRLGRESLWEIADPERQWSAPSCALARPKITALSEGRGWRAAGALTSRSATGEGLLVRRREARKAKNYCFLSEVWKRPLIRPSATFSPGGCLKTRYFWVLHSVSY